MKLPNIIIHPNTPLKELRFTTAGDWTMREDGTFEIWLCEIEDWRYQFIVLIHELTEWAWCLWRGVGAGESDAFDALWESELKMGLHLPEEEAGFDKRAPYRGGHVWGARMEWVFCYILGIGWRKYCETWNEFFRKFPK